MKTDTVQFFVAIKSGIAESKRIETHGPRQMITPRVTSSLTYLLFLKNCFLMVFRLDKTSILNALPLLRLEIT